MQTQESQHPEGPFVIRSMRCECTVTNYCELCQAIERLGGVRRDAEFTFATAHERTVAADVLADKFGTRYFELL